VYNQELYLSYITRNNKSGKKRKIMVSGTHIKIKDINACRRLTAAKSQGTRKRRRPSIRLSDNPEQEAQILGIKGCNTTAPDMIQ